MENCRGLCPEAERVYNLEVDEDHRYWVGEQGLSVPSNSPGMPGAAGGGQPQPVVASTPKRGIIPQAEVDAVRRAWAQNGQDIGLGLYQPSTGEIRVGTFDTTAQRMGHDGLQMTFGIPDADRPQWRGFVFSSGGQAINLSGFNIPDGIPPRMHADSFAQVEDALRRAGLI